MKHAMGTREWSQHSVNIATGCEHGCRYCFARANALRFERIADRSEWTTPHIRQREVDKARCKLKGRVMFPTTHDITPTTLSASLMVLTKLLDAGNEVLIVSKPHLDCIDVLCSRLILHRDRILFRFTIGSRNPMILHFWEPGAPRYLERRDALKCAHGRGYRTSVSVEPMLESARIVLLFHELKPYVTDSIWIGKMNRIASRVQFETPEERAAVQAIVDGQTDERIRDIYETLKNEPLVRWKESIKRVVGLPLAEEAGLDR